MPLKIVFMGTPDFSVPVLDAVVGAGHEVIAAYTRAPKPAGRGMELRRSPVHVRADALGIPVLTPKTLRTEEAQAELAALNADIAVVAAYGLILPQAVLDTPKHGCLNVHGSLLPRWRGAAPINRAVMAGDPESGVMVMKMEEGLDTGPVALTARVAIGPNMTAGELHDALSPTGAALMAEALGQIENGSISFVSQGEDGVTYASKITNEETRVDWRLAGAAVHDHVRGLSPFPGAWFMADLGKGEERVKLLRAERAEGSGAPGSLVSAEGLVACGDGAVRLLTVQRAGSKAMSFADFARGARLAPGFQFG